MSFNMDNHNTGVIILAAGRGKRMHSTTDNKVVSILHNKPMVGHIVEFMEKIEIGQIIVVVGFAKESVMNALKGHVVSYVEQPEQLGTGHGVEVAIGSLHPDITDVIVVYGDDAVLYNGKNSEVVEDLIRKHQDSKSAITFLSIEQDNPIGLGRIVRNEMDEVIGIVEEKNATESEREIKEINPGCFIFSVDFLNKYIKEIKKNELTGEFYLTDLVDIARTNRQLVNTVRGGKLLWRGVNTPEELIQAEKLLS